MLILILVSVFFAVCLIIGIAQYIREPKPPGKLTYNQYYNYYHNKEWRYIEPETTATETETEETPFYIIDKLAAYDNQIESYNNILELLNLEYKNTADNMKRAIIRKKQSDLMLKLATIEEKAHKLQIKTDI